MKLNLGCGRDIREGWINLDHIQLPGVDVVHDLTCVPLPFEKETFDEILCKDVLEHIDYIPVLKDLHRILKPEGILKIKVPHFTSSDAYLDPTHRYFFAVNTFDYFTANHKFSYYVDFHFSKVERTHLNFLKRPAYFYNTWLEAFINRTPKLQSYYEKSFLRLFPAWTLEVTLVK